MWKYKGTRIVKLSWKRQVKLDDLHCGFKTYYKSTLRECGIGIIMDIFLKTENKFRDRYIWVVTYFHKVLR